MSDKRAAERYDFFWKVHYKTVTGFTFFGYIVDISQTGIKAFYEKTITLDIGEMVDFKISLINFDNEPDMFFKGKCVWKKDHPSSKRLNIGGFEFTELPLDEQKRVEWLSRLFIDRVSLNGK